MSKVHFHLVYNLVGIEHVVSLGKAKENEGSHQNDWCLEFCCLNYCFNIKNRETAMIHVSVAQLISQQSHFEYQMP